MNFQNDIAQGRVTKDVMMWVGATVGNFQENADFRNHYLEIRVIGEEGKPECYFLEIGAELESQLVKIVERANVNCSHVYVGVALRDNNKSGKESDCSIITFLVVDHDEIDGLKIKDIEDPGEREAARQKILERLENETDFAPTMIIDSGNGYHAYYSFDAAINVREFAVEIKRKCKWLADRYDDCPGDPAMLKIAQPIRLPGSLNVKNLDDIKPCQIVKYDPTMRYSFAEIPEAELKKIHPKLPGLSVNTTSMFQSEYPFEKCAFLRWMCEHPAEQTYSLWLAAASTLAYFGEDGREAFHKLSHQYSKYSENATNSMFDKMLVSYQKGIGPITYTKLAEYGCNLADETEAASPATYIESIYQTQTLADMGLTFSEESGKPIFNPNIFADFFLRQYQLLICEGKVFYNYQNGVWRPLPEYSLTRKIRELFQSVKKNIYRSWIGEQSIEMLKLAATEAREMDTHKHLLNLTNGMLDTNNLALISHDPSYLSTVQVPLAYDPEARCERFEKFGDEIMEGDAERVAVMQELIGYLLTAETIIQKAFFLYGEGSNGKSLLLEIVTLLIGSENVANLSLHDLESSFQRSALIGKTVNIATENEINPKGFNSQYFKAIVSGDRITVEKKHENSITYAPISKMVFAVNNLPYSPDKSHGLYRRIFILPFDRRFDGKQADKHLKKKLQTELAGILNWALVGLQRLRANDYEFTQSAVIEEAISRYKQEQNPMLDYMREMLEINPEVRTEKSKIIEKYQVWCQRNGLGDVVKMSPQKFWNIFKMNCKTLDFPFDQQTSSGVRYLKELSFRELGGRGRQSHQGVINEDEGELAEFMEMVA